jgi:hypothetical protein
VKSTSSNFGIALGFAKSVFQVHGVDAGGAVVIRKKALVNQAPSTHDPKRT